MNRHKKNPWTQPFLITVLMTIVGIAVFTDRTDAADVTVQELDKAKTSKDGNEQADAYQHTTADKVLPVGAKFWIESATFKPPHPWKFKPFGDGTHYDAIPKTEVIPHVALLDSDTMIQLLWPAVDDIPSADGWPLKVEGNMEKPSSGPGGSIPEAHWGAIVHATNPYIDLDIDSENHWDNEYFTTNFRTEYADQIEDDEGKEKPGKHIFVNDIDKDGDNVSDYMDGWDCPTSQVSELRFEGGSRSSNSNGKFVPMILEIPSLPPLVNTNDVRIKFTYQASSPASMQKLTPSYTGSLIRTGPPTYAPNHNFDAEQVKSSSGNIRIWTKDENQNRDPDDDYVPSDTVYALYEIGMGVGIPKTFYVETINAHSDWSGVRIVAEISYDGGTTWSHSDAVRCTAMRSNFHAGVVRPFSFSKINGSRRLYEPEYDSPAEFLSHMYDKKRDGGWYWSKVDELNIDNSMDPLYHDGDALLGHGYAYIEYEGPDLGDAMSTNCASSPFDSTVFIGKTGYNAFIWKVGLAPTYSRLNYQEELVWWKYCPYKIESKPLCLSRGYTLHFDRLSEIHNDMLKASNYAGFSVHIDETNGYWGCMSNVGLALEKHSFDGFTGANKNWKFSDTAPSTINRSIEAIMRAGGDYARDNGKPGLDVMDDVMEAIIDETDGLDWGENGDTAALRAALFDVLEGKDFDDLGVISTPADLGIVGGTEPIEYYDPGLAPADLESDPNDIFDMKESSP